MTSYSFIYPALSPSESGTFSLTGTFNQVGSTITILTDSGGNLPTSITYNYGTGVAPFNTTYYAEGLGNQYQYISINPSFNTVTFFDIQDGLDIEGSYTVLTSTPCLTNSCNILTPSGYINVSELKINDLILTDDNRQVPIIKIFKSIIENSKPRLIKAHQYGRNLPMIDTFISDYHAYQVNKKWKLPCKANLPQQWHEGENKITYYHLQLPDYFNDNLIVNGLVMEGWDGKMPHELKEYQWKQIGNKFLRVIKN